MKGFLLALCALPACGAVVAAAPPPACGAPGHRQFDFWVGLWHVTGPKGGFAGINRIRPIDGGCALQESWSASRGGYTGTSLNWLGPDGRWHQRWIDSQGQSLELDGGLVGSAMVMEGRTPNPKSPGRSLRQRITWTPLEPGLVRQLWESSADDGANWTVSFDGKYRRIDEASHEPPPLAAQLAGNWIGTGRIQGADVAVTLTLQPALAQRTWELHWQNLGSGDGKGRFEGRATYDSWSKEGVTGSWWDSGGGRFELQGTSTDRSLDMHWGQAGRTVYTLTAEDELEVVDSLKTRDGSWKEFGRSKLRRQ